MSPVNHRRVRPSKRGLRRVALIAAVLTGVPIAANIGTPSSAATTAITSVEVVGPTGSVGFGERTHVLANGNFVVTDSNFGLPGVPSVGAVYLYNGATNALISTLRGSHAQDRVGRGGIVDVGSNSFVVLSPLWNGQAAGVGAATTVDGSTGLNGVVDAANSLIGSSSGDFASSDIVPLSNGNFVVVSSAWDNGAGVENAGAVTWSSAASPTVGEITSGNSLVGSFTGNGDRMAVVTLTNGNYVTVTEDFGLLVRTGAATWGNGATGTTGAVSAQNSLTGSNSGDIAGGYVVPLTDGNYVVASPNWGNGAESAGAVTWRPGNQPVGGTVINATNSLVGNARLERVGSEVDALTNGNYVVNTPGFDDGPIQNIGAVTWGNGSVGISGLVSSENSLVGRSQGDSGSSTVTALTNGNYVVSSPSWDATGVADVGAVTFRLGDAAHAPAQIVAGNSLVGVQENDFVGTEIEPLRNGNYAVGSVIWRNSDGIDVGAATWGDGVHGTTGQVTAANSLIGSQRSDRTGRAITALSNGAYVVSSEARLGTIEGAGAVTWRVGDRASPGVVSPVNSLVGATTLDLVGNIVLALPSGAYVVIATEWDNNGVVDAGAVTFGRPDGATVGPITTANSVVGTATDEGDGQRVAAFADGTYAILTPAHSAGVQRRVGAVTPAPAAGVVGTATAENSLIGSLESAGTGWRIATDDDQVARLTAAESMLVGRRLENRVTLIDKVVPPAPPTTPPSPPTTPSTGPATTPTTTPTTSGTPGTIAPEFLPLAPARLADTRIGATTVDGVEAGTGARAPGSTIELQVAGRGGVPADATAVALNVTAVDPGGAGFLTIYPCDVAQPTASNVNFSPGATVPNAVIAKVGNDRRVCIFTSQQSDLVVDVNGAFPASSPYAPLVPARVLDTRADGTTVDSAARGSGPATAGSTTTLHLGARGGLPNSVNSAVLNITSTQAVAPGFVTVYPCDSSRPTTSNLNLAPGADVANLVVTKTSANGDVCLFTSQTTQLVVDVNGFFPTTSTYTSFVPGRVLDTRAGFTTIDGINQSGGVATAGATARLHITGRAGVPGDATSVVLNVTITEPVGPGFVTVFPCGIEPPLASNVNYVGGQTAPNTAIVKVGAGGDVCLVSSQTTHLIVDVSGAFNP